MSHPKAKAGNTPGPSGAISDGRSPAAGSSKQQQQQVCTVSLRSHLASVLQAAGGAESLVGRRVWSFWYADISMVQRGASHGASSSSPVPSGEDAGSEDQQPDDAEVAGDGSVLMSPVRGNWYEAVVTSVDPKDSSIQV